MQKYNSETIVRRVVTIDIIVKVKENVKRKQFCKGQAKTPCPSLSSKHLI